MTKIDLLEHLHSLKERAESDYARAVELKNVHLISASLGRLNAIDRDIMAEERHRKELQIAKDYPIDWNSPQNRAIEAHRQYLIGQLECLSGKSMKEILSQKDKPKTQKAS